MAQTKPNDWLRKFKHRQRTSPDKIVNLAPLQSYPKHISEESLYIFTCFDVFFFDFDFNRKFFLGVILICDHAYIFAHMVVYCALQNFYIKRFFLSLNHKNRCILLSSTKCIQMVDASYLPSEEIQDFSASLAPIFDTNS